MGSESYCHFFFLFTGRPLRNEKMVTPTEGQEYGALEAQAPEKEMGLR